MRAFVGWCLTVALAAGCGDASEGVIRGRVTLDSEPVRGAYVRFNPMTNIRIGAGFATTDANGRYEIPLGEHPGRTMHPGEYFVLITDGEPAVPALYGNGKTVLSVTVTRGVNDVTWELTGSRPTLQGQR
jgi:hypothetical protein